MNRDFRQKINFYSWYSCHAVKNFMEIENIWEKPVSHGEILKRIWKNLDLGTLQRKHPFHLPVFGTICDRSPEMRMVVLRRFWRRPPMLAFHSHIGSPKINQMKSNPNVYWLFYHPEDTSSNPHQRQSDNSHERRISRRTMAGNRTFFAPLLCRRTADAGKPKTDFRFARRFK